MKILAIDPALRHTGCVLFEDGQPSSVRLLTTESKKEKWMTVAEKDQEDMSDWTKSLRSAIREFRPDLICSEQSLGGGRNAFTVKTLALVNGAMYAMSTEDAMPPWVFTRVHDAKKAVTGKTTATKNEMIEGVVRIFPSIRKHLVSSKSSSGWNDNAEHIADACASYLVCINNPAVRLMMNQGK